MNDDTDVTEPSQEGKQSKRALLKGALARTKSKFKREDKDKGFTLSDDVNDFLAAGRHQTHQDDRLPLAPSLNSSASDLPQRQPSPRGVSVPRLDVSHTTRFPETRPVDTTDPRSGQTLLAPDHAQRERSQSFGSFKKRRPRPRNLSVSFDNRPPEIIGVGGDESEQPTVEISRLRNTNALSPMPVQRPSSNHSHSSQGSSSSIHRKPLPQHANPFADDNSLPIKPLRRAPTGAESIKSPTEHEYELSMGKAMVNHKANATPGQFKTAVISPKPIHPPVAPPQVRSPPPPPPPPVSNHTLNYMRPDAMLKQGNVHVTVTDADLIDRQPTLPTQTDPSLSEAIVRGPDSLPIISHQQVAHRKKSSLNETETMTQGKDGWL